MKYILPLLFSSIFVFFLSTISVKAETEFDMDLSNFYQKQEKASKILKEIETDLKDGSRDQVCTKQREAARYGIEGTESLIKALKKNGSKAEIENLQTGLNRWRELKDYCY